MTLTQTVANKKKKGKAFKAVFRTSELSIIKVKFKMDLHLITKTTQTAVYKRSGS